MSSSDLVLDNNLIAQGASELSQHAAEVGHHADPVVPVLYALIIIFLAAKLGAIVSNQIGQPPVLGELLAGVVVGNLALLHFTGFDFIKTDPVIDIFSRIGVIILLFEVGLETRVKDMMAVGVRSLLVAIVGVVSPFLLGYYAVAWIIPDMADITRIFMGAVLTATSVGITVRVFKDLGKVNCKEAWIVLGAAVIDDILGLIILAIVSGLAVTGNIQADDVIGISAKAIGFVVLALVAGVLLARRTIKLLSFFRMPGMMIASALTLCFLGAYLADQAGLATIVGAFAVGLVLEELHFKPFEDKYTIEEYIHPIAMFFVPVFFVMTGMNVDLSVFADLNIIGAALVISLIAIFGKVISGWSFPSDTKINRAVIGFGMVPRGEVGLIFAIVGKSIGILDDSLYAITVLMVIITTLVAPPLLSFFIKRDKIAEQVTEPATSQEVKVEA